MIRVLSFTEAGDSGANEDAFAVRTLEPDRVVCFVADGQGGRAGGCQAARLASETATEFAANLPPEQLTNRLAWAGLIRKVDDAVQADPVAGFTTLVGLCVIGNRIVGASCGDSAALLVTENTATELTRGKHKDPPIGSGAIPAVTFDTTATAPWQLLMLTDGVWKYAGWERVIEAARRDRGTELLEALQRAARLPGSGRFQDDFTVVLLEQAE